MIIDCGWNFNGCYHLKFILNEFYGIQIFNRQIYQKQKFVILIIFVRTNLKVYKQKFFQYITKLRKLFVSGTWVAKIFHTRAARKYFIAKFWQFVDLALIVNVYMLYWLFIQTFYTVSNEATIKKSPWK